MTFFDGDEIPETARRMLEQAPPDLDPMTLLRHGLRQVGWNASTATARRCADAAT